MKRNNFDKLIARTSFISFVFVGSFLFYFSSTSEAAIDPVAAYCESMGYTFIVEETADGPTGMCEFPNGQRVIALEFLLGKAAPEWSYCEVNGLQSKHAEDTDVCKSCCVCVLGDGTEVEVMQLMGLNLRESKCGDGTCGDPENYETCPEDCPSGGWDGYCDGIADNTVDPDCAEGEDPDWAASVPGDLDDDGDVDRNDLNVILGFRNKPATVCAGCDLDDDFIITALDARKLVLLCTRSRCATE